MTLNWPALIIGFLFGAGLILSGLANPDKIIGTLRLKDFHAMRTIAVFVLIGILGVWILGLAGEAHLSIKPATLVTIAIGGALLGIGFGMTGYCPGTGLACGASGRFDALVCVLGMFAGAWIFIWLYPHYIMPLEKIANYGKATIPEITKVPSTVWALGLVIIGFCVLYLTKPKKKV